MSTIADLVINLKANVAHFQAGMSEAQKALHNVEKSVESMKHVIEALGAIEIGTKIIEHFRELASEALKTVESTYQLAKATGASTQGIAAMRLAAQAAGVGTEAMDASLRHLNRSLAESVNGTGPAAHAMERLGLSARELARLSADQAFAEIAEGIKNIQSPAERAQVAVELFGKAGVELLPVLVGGKEGLADAADEAKRFGLSLNELDVAKVHDAAIALESLKLAGEGLGSQLVVQFAPYIEALVAKFKELSANGSDIGAKVAQGIEVAKDVVWGLANAAQAVYGAFKLVQLGIYGIVDASVSAEIAVVELGNAINKKLGLGANTESLESMKAVQRNVHETALAIKKDMDGLFSGGSWADKIQQAMLDAEAASRRHAEATKTTPGGGELAQTFKQLEQAQKLMAGIGASSAGASEAQKKAEQLDELVHSMYAQAGAAIYSTGAVQNEYLALVKLADEAHHASDNFDLIADAQKRVKETADIGAKIDEQIAMFGKAAAAIDVYKAGLAATAAANDLAAAQAAHAGEAVLSQAKAAAEAAAANLAHIKAGAATLAGLEATKKAQEDAKKIIDESITPAERYAAQMEHVQELLYRNALTADQATAAAKRYRDELEHANKAGLGQLGQFEVLRLGGDAAAGKASAFHGHDVESRNDWLKRTDFTSRDAQNAEHGFKGHGVESRDDWLTRKIDDHVAAGIARRENTDRIERTAGSTPSAREANDILKQIRDNTARPATAVFGS